MQFKKRRDAGSKKFESLRVTCFINLKIYYDKCRNFMEQIYSTERQIFCPFLIKLSLKMIGWKEQEPETELSIKHLKLSIAHYFKACSTVFL